MLVDGLRVEINGRRPVVLRKGLVALLLESNGLLGSGRHERTAK